jgi:3',5'-cyclic AMP phosphodiesterase CpdA
LVRIAQISDLHVRGARVKSAKAFDRYLIDCIAAVNACAPDVVIATGDLTQTGSEEEYRRLRELMSSLTVAYYVTPGNHDDPTALRRVYRDHRYLFEADSHLSYTVDAGDVRLLILDSMKPGRAGGYLDAIRLSWLQQQLQSSREPVMIALHHPPFATGVWPMDWLGFAHLRELEQLVRSHTRVRRIASGHVHCARTAFWGGTVACSSPSIAPQHLLIGLGWRVPKFHFEPSGFLMHIWNDGGDVVTHVHRTSGSVEVLAPP